MATRIKCFQTIRYHRQPNRSHSFFRRPSLYIAGAANVQKSFPIISVHILISAVLTFVATFITRFSKITKYASTPMLMDDDEIIYHLSHILNDFPINYLFFSHKTMIIFFSYETMQTMITMITIIFIKNSEIIF